MWRVPYRLWHRTRSLEQQHQRSWLGQAVREGKNCYHCWSAPQARDRCTNARVEEAATGSNINCWRCSNCSSTEDTPYFEVCQNGPEHRRFLPTPLGQGVFSEDHYLHETSPGMQRPNRRACLSVEAGFFQTQGIPPSITTSCISSYPTTSDHNPCACRKFINQSTWRTSYSSSLKH